MLHRLLFGHYFIAGARLDHGYGNVHARCQVCGRLKVVGTHLTGPR